MESYRKIRQIGQGAAGAVFLVEEKKTGDKYVIKIVNMARMTVEEQQKVLREVSLLADMEHPNIVQYRESFKAGGCVHIVMEYCEGGDLFTAIASQRGKPLQVIMVHFNAGHLGPYHGPCRGSWSIGGIFGKATFC